MRHLLFFLLIISYFSAYAQLGVEKREACWEKAAKRNTMRYAPSDCGLLPGVIDCNDKLEYDESQDIFFAKGSGKPYTGDCETCHRNGIREHLIHFVGGKQDGVDTTYYETGCPMAIRSLALGVENGAWTYYYDSTAIPAWIIHYVNGALDGQSIYFEKNGDTTKWENYTAGLLNGVKRTYYPDSKLQEEVSYKNGVLEGNFLTYFEDGKLSKKLFFKAGKKDGKLEYFYNNGALLTVENYTNGIKNGEFKTFFINGDLQTSETYVKGKKEGAFIEKYENGRTKSEYYYAKDVLIEFREYDEYGRLTKGTPKDQSTMEDDKLPGQKKEEAKPKQEKKKKEQKKPTSEVTK